MTRVCPCREVWTSPQPSLHEYRSTRWLLWKQLRVRNLFLFFCVYRCVYVSELTEAAKTCDSALWGFHCTVPTSHLLWRPIFLGGSDGASRFTMYRKRRLEQTTEAFRIRLRDWIIFSSGDFHLQLRLNFSYSNRFVFPPSVNTHIKPETHGAAVRSGELDLPRQHGVWAQAVHWHGGGLKTQKKKKKKKKKTAKVPGNNHHVEQSHQLK